MGRFQPPKGLYVALEAGDKLETQDEKVVISTFNDEENLVGARFDLGGLVFILYLNDRRLNRVRYDLPGRTEASSSGLILNTITGPSIFN